MRVFLNVPDTENSKNYETATGRVNDFMMHNYWGQWLTKYYSV